MEVDLFLEEEDKGLRASKPKIMGQIMEAEDLGDFVQQLPRLEEMVQLVSS
jgi:hypothetical protein